VAKRSERASGRGARLISCAVLGAGSVWPASAAADDIPDTAAWRSNTGVVTGLGFMLLLPPDGNAGVGADFSARYGMPAGPFILAPGALIGGYYLQSRFVGVLMGTFRVTAPLGPLAPFVQGGIGPGFITKPGDGGAAWMGGGGLVVHIGDVVAIGVEIDYQAITGTGYETWTLGPTIAIGG